MRIKPHRLLFAALLAPAFISPAVNAQEATEASPPTALTGREVLAKARANARTQGWELGIDLMQPRRIEIEQPDGSAKAYWYVIYKVTNANTRNEGDSPDTAVGIPVSTDINFFVETVAGADALNEPHSESVDNDLLKKIRLEVIRQRTGLQLDDLENKASQREDYEKYSADRQNKEIADIRYDDAYRSHGDANNHYVLEKIAEAEGLRYIHNVITGKDEMGLQPASAMMQQLGLVYDLENETELYYPADERHRAVPRLGQMAAAANPDLTYIKWSYPGVDSDGALVRWYGEDELEITESAKSAGQMNHKGTTVILGPASKWYGMLLKTRYKSGDVVDSTGRPVSEAEPSYHQSLSNFGVRENGGGIVEVAKTRFYEDGQKVLNGFDTGVSNGQGGNANHVVYGRILDNGDLFDAEIASAQRADEGRLRRGPDAEDEINDTIGRESDALDNIETIDSSTQFFGRDIVGQPVKVLDRFGRAITRELVLYGVGDWVSADEYSVWASRFGVKTSYAASGLDKRPLSESDFMIGRPKIRMGQAADGKTFERDSKTGRRYKIAEVSADNFQRDADGTYFTYRIAPIMGADESDSATKYYEYAPLGKAAKGAVPIPSFDSFGVWKDWTHPATGKKVLLRDAQGNPVRNAFGIDQYVKSYEYEWRYAFEKTPQLDDMAHDRDRESDESFNAQTLIKPARETVPVWKDDQGNFANLALRTVYYKIGDKHYPIAKVIDESDFDKDAWLSAYQAGDLLKDATFGFTSAEEHIVAGAIAPASNGLTYDAEYRLTQHQYDSIVTRYKSNPVDPEGNYDSSNTPLKKDTHLEANKIEATAFETDLGNPIFKTWERFTLPAPIVENGVVKTREMVKLASGLRADDSDAIYDTKRLISERYGVLILDGVDDGWDFMNIYVRGLRSPFDTTSLVKKGESSHHTRKAVYKDWAYMQRFSKPGDEYNVKRDLITRGRGRWFLLND